MRRRVKTFLEKTRAMGVSGYSVKTGWTHESWAPALGLELILFSSIKPKHLEHGRHFPALRQIVKGLKSRFRDCGFDMYTRPSR